MTKLNDQINSEIKQAMKAGDKLTLDVLRMVSAAIKNKEIEIRPQNKEITDDDIVQIIKTQVKKRREAADLYQKGSRSDLADKELNEIKVIERYLPQQMDEQAISKILDKIIAQTPTKEFGPLMKEVMQELKGKADASLISKLLKTKLEKN